LEQTLSEFKSSEVLHIGDHDPCGAHIFSSAMQDVQAFSERFGNSLIRFTRLAVTPTQIR
jgi:hypothetical protein